MQASARPRASGEGAPGLREEIRAVLGAHGPLALADLFDKLTLCEDKAKLSTELYLMKQAGQLRQEKKRGPYALAGSVRPRGRPSATLERLMPQAPAPAAGKERQDWEESEQLAAIGQAPAAGVKRINPDRLQPGAIFDARRADLERLADQAQQALDDYIRAHCDPAALDLLAGHRDRTRAALAALESTEATER